MKESTTYILNKLLKYYSILIDEKELEFQFESHPSFPSLHSITGVFSHFNIENAAFELPKTEEVLDQLPECFIAYIKEETHDYLSLITVKNNQYEVLIDRKNKSIVSREKFLKLWSGILVAIDEDKEYLVEKRDDSIMLKFLYIITVFAFVALFFINKTSIFSTFHYILSLIGIAVCILIVQHEFGIKSKPLEKICTGKSDKTSCDDVLKSDAARLYKNIKLSDVGLVYFASISLSWIGISLFKIVNISHIIAITLLIVPFTFYSIYYQYAKVKKWCPLCLTVVSILWLQAFSLFTLKPQIFPVSLELASVLPTFLAFLVTATVWIPLNEKLRLEKNLRSIKIDYNRFKNNYNVFRAFILKNTKYNTTINHSSEIIFGNKSKNAPLKIIMVTNPLCGHCKNAHMAIEPILNLKNENIQIRIRFNVNLNDKGAIATKIAMRLIEIYHENNEERTLASLHDIYTKIPPEKWFEKWGVAKSSQFFHELEIESQWCQSQNINFTPELLINGRAFPNEYERFDLKYFIEDIIEDEMENKEKLETENLEFITQ